MRELIAEIECFLLDMDGTFYLGEELIDGSLEFIEAVKNAGKSFLFLTNNSSRGASHYIEKLWRLGVEVPLSRVLTSGQATGEYLRREFANTPFYLLGNDSLRDELYDYGVNFVDPWDCKEQVALCVGFDTTLSYGKLCVACDILRQTPSAPFVATHPDFNCPTESGFIPDIGAILAFLKASTGRDPDIIIGKPHYEIVRSAMERTGFPKEKLMMIGDRLYTDIRTGVDHGLRSALVLTGEATLADLKESGMKPDLVLERLSDIVPYL